MFLTEFEINPMRRGGRRLLTSPQAMHAATLLSFHDDSAQDPSVGRVLWRVDFVGPRATLYVVSPAKPDLTHLVEQAGWPTTQTWRTVEYSPFVASLSSGQEWAFRLTANPTHSGRRTPGGQTQRFGHVTVAQQEQWLTSRAGRCGFEVRRNSIDALELAVSERSQRTFQRRGETVTISMATYEGRLLIREPDALRTALTHGIGRAKAYGCGLMTLAPVR